MIVNNENELEKNIVCSKVEITAEDGNNLTKP